MSAAVVIAASNLLPALCARLAEEGELLTFADTEPAEALQTILERRPRLIVLEQLFAGTPRGAALINRLRNDAQLSGAEVRVMSHTGDYARQVSPSQPDDATAGIDVPSVMVGEDYAAVPLASGPEPDAPTSPGPSWRGTRRAVRYHLRQNVQIQVDGNPLSVVDMSAVGAQVVSSAVLRPNQRVRVSVTTDNFVMRFRATVAWAKFELSNGSEPQRYRAGLEFTDADRAAMEEYCARHKR
jgi:CheY-like chemotaxis protein